MSQKFEIYSPLDMHLHLREGAMAKIVTPLSSAHFSGGIIMPNLVPPISNMNRLLDYRSQIEPLLTGTGFTPLFTLFLRQYDENELRELRPYITACKLYPAGVTTNSHGGVSDITQLLPTISLLEELDIPLLVHGETHGYVLDREDEFLPTYKMIATTFPRLRIMMEHITTRGAVDLLDQYDNLFATITVHHLVTSLDDVIGGLLNPHLFCKPIPKHYKDRDALRKLAFSNHPKVSFGSDSAPHPRDQKECFGCAAGVFTAPVAIPLLTDIFEKAGRLDSLQSFISDNAIRNYKIDVPRKKVTLEKKSWRVPESYQGIVPMMSGQELAWQVVKVENG